MEFRAPAAATEQNDRAIRYLTKNLGDPDTGRGVVERLLNELGNAVEAFPDWHPILTIPRKDVSAEHVSSISEIEAYRGIDHTVSFARGFVTCPYSEGQADQLFTTVNSFSGLHAYRLQSPLYMDNACPVVVEAQEVELDGDGTIVGRDALRWFAQQAIMEAEHARVAETWWNVRGSILGHPHGARSSLFVNQYTAVHMRKILEALNNSGIYGPIKESSLDMLSEKKRGRIGDTLIRTALTKWDKQREKFDFNLRGEICKAEIRDTWGDGEELSIRVEIGEFDLFVRGFYYPKTDRIDPADPRGKRALAEKFL